MVFLRDNVLTLYLDDNLESLYFYCITNITYVYLKISPPTFIAHEQLSKKKHFLFFFLRDSNACVFNYVVWNLNCWNFYKYLLCTLFIFYSVYLILLSLFAYVPTSILKNWKTFGWDKTLCKNDEHNNNFVYAMWFGQQMNM